MIGEPLPRQPIAWFWVAAFGLPAVYLSYRAAVGEVSPWIPLALGDLSILYLTAPFLRKRQTETTEFGNDGISQFIDCEAHRLTTVADSEKH
jgi:hypothetical protein